MGKNGELWDDSALIKALDDAISKYKVMHPKGDNNGSVKEERITQGTEESSPIVFNETNETKSVHVEPNDNNTTENCHSEVVEQNVSPSNGDDQVQDPNNMNINAKSAEDYNVLLNQYNAIEEQRQKLLEQLYQHGNWDYQGYGYGAAYDSQYYPVPTPQPLGPTICSCRSYVCPYSTAASCKTCGSSLASAHRENSVSLDDGGFIKAAMGAVDRAIGSFNTQTSGEPEVDKEGKKGREVETASVNVAQEKTSQTDLSVVLNAWFSAGFYTGKYLSEQSSAKK